MRRIGIIFSFFVMLGVLLYYVFPNSMDSPQVKSRAFSFVLAKLLSHDVPEMGVDTFKLHRSDYLILDTRSEEEFKVSHIPGALWVGYTEFDKRKLQNIPKEKKILVYCSIGYRSEEIGRRLRALGYTHVQNLYGGIFEWVNQGGELKNETQDSTQALHAYNRMWGIWVDSPEKVY